MNANERYRFEARVFEEIFNNTPVQHNFLILTLQALGFNFFLTAKTPDENEFYSNGAIPKFWIPLLTGISLRRV